MAAQDTEENPASLDLAAALLRAWIDGDAERLKTELAHNLDSAGFTEEGAELLGAIVARMRGCRDLFAPRRQDPALDLCIDLLSHLVNRDCDAPRPLTLSNPQPVQ